MEEVCTDCGAILAECPKGKHNLVQAGYTSWPSPGMRRIVLTESQARRYLEHYGTGGNWVGENIYHMDVNK